MKIQSTFLTFAVACLISANCFAFGEANEKFAKLIVAKISNMDVNNAKSKDANNPQHVKIATKLDIIRKETLSKSAELAKMDDNSTEAVKLRDEVKQLVYSYKKVSDMYTKPKAQ